MLLKAAIPFNCSSPEYLSPHKRQKNRVSPVSRASPAHMNSPLALKSLEVLILRDKCYTVYCFLLEEKIATNPKFYNAIYE